MTGLQLTVAGRLPTAVSDTIWARFGDCVQIRPVAGRTLLNVADMDQPALRALLILLWDFGHDILCLSSGAVR